MKTINRYLWLVLLAAGLLTLFACGDWKNKDRQMLKESCYKINQMVKDVDFHSGQIQEDTLVLFDKEHMPVKEIPLTVPKFRSRFWGSEKGCNCVFYCLRRCR